MKLDENEIVSLISEIFHSEKGEITTDSKISDFARDSMDIIEFVAVLKQRHNVEIDSTAMSELRDVREIVNYITTHQK